MQRFAGNLQRCPVSRQANHMPETNSNRLHRIHVPSGDGHALAVTLAGVSRDATALVIHGGPGGHSRVDPALFDLERMRVIWMDQRGCGRSRPHSSLRRNVTAALVRDIETVRRALGVEHWLVMGGSWGAALALAWAGTHPDHLDGLLLRGAYLAGRRETQRFFMRGRGCAPRQWHALMRAAGATAASQLLHCCIRMSQHAPTPARRALGISWGRYEEALLGLGGAQVKRVGRRDADALADKFRIQGRFLARGCWLSGDRLRRLTAALRRSDCPVLAVHGRHDRICPPSNLDRLRVWLPAITTRLVDAGHRQDEPAMAEALRCAIDALATAACKREPQVAIAPR